jgi:hypothetical protein
MFCWFQRSLSFVQKDLYCFQASKASRERVCSLRCSSVLDDLFASYRKSLIWPAEGYFSE